MQGRQRVRLDGNDRFGGELQPTLEQLSAARSTSQAARLSVADSLLPQALILIGQRLT